MSRPWLEDEQLIALENGPKHGQWYYRADFDELIAATSRAANQYQPRLDCLDYHPAGRTITRHIGRAGAAERIATADVYTYQPRKAAR